MALRQTGGKNDKKSDVSLTGEYVSGDSEVSQHTSGR